MAFNMNQLAKMQKLKSLSNRFQRNHPKFFPFLKAVSSSALMRDTIIEINVTTPDGRQLCSNIKFNEEDMDLMEALKDLGASNP